MRSSRAAANTAIALGIFRASLCLPRTGAKGVRTRVGRGPTRAFFVSGLPGDEVEVRAFEVGAADFIRKQVKNQVLLARVAKVLRET